MNLIISFEILQIALQTLSLSYNLNSQTYLSKSHLPRYGITSVGTGLELVTLYVFSEDLSFHVF